MEHQRDELNHEMRTRLLELFASIVCVKIDGTTDKERKRRINLLSNRGIVSDSENRVCTFIWCIRIFLVSYGSKRKTWNFSLIFVRRIKRNRFLIDKKRLKDRLNIDSSE